MKKSEERICMESPCGRSGGDNEHALDVQLDLLLGDGKHRGVGHHQLARAVHHGLEGSVPPATLPKEKV